jgi:hypothetical protein
MKAGAVRACRPRFTAMLHLKANKAWLTAAAVVMGLALSGCGSSNQFSVGLEGTSVYWPAHAMTANRGSSEFGWVRLTLSPGALTHLLSGRSADFRLSCFDGSKLVLFSELTEAELAGVPGVYGAVRVGREPASILVSNWQDDSCAIENPSTGAVYTGSIN